MVISIGRKTLIGIGRETTPGTEATTIYGFEFSGDPTISDLSSKLEDKSGIGRIEDSVGSRETYTEGTITLEGIIDAKEIGHILYAIFGTLATQIDTPEAGAFSHDFTVKNDSAHPTYSIIYYNEQFGGARAHLNSVLKTATITLTEKEFAKVTLEYLCKKSVPSAKVITYTCNNAKDTHYVGKTVSVKFANDTSGLALATAKPFTSFTLTFNKNAMSYAGIGYDSASRLFNQGFRCEFSGEIIFEDKADFYDKNLANTRQAMQVQFLDMSYIIPTTTTPYSLTITSPYTTIASVEIPRPLDTYLTQSISGMIHYDRCDTPTPRSISATLINDIPNATY